jgi:hypothetical protein
MDLTNIGFSLLISVIDCSTVRDLGELSWNVPGYRDYHHGPVFTFFAIYLFLRAYGTLPNN